MHKQLCTLIIKKTVEAELSLFLCYLSCIVVVAFEPENACEYISHSFGIVMHVIRLHKMGPHCARRLIVDKNAGIKVVRDQSSGQAMRVRGFMLGT